MFSSLTEALIVRSQAYWVPLPAEFLTAAGAIVAQWSYFEIQFGAVLLIYRRNPVSAQLGEPRPAFKDRVRYLKDLAPLVFPTCNSLVQKVTDFADRAHDASKKRNILVHGAWFDMTPFDAEKGVTISTKPDGTGDFYSVSLPEVEALAQKIPELKLQAIFLSFPPGIETPSLTEAEEGALRRHHTDYPPLAQPESSKRRPQNRVGTPQRPERFRA